MAIKLSNTLRNKIIDSGIAGQFGTGMVRIYGGTQPTNAGDATTSGTLCEINGILWGAASNGTATLLSSYLGTATFDLTIFGTRAVGWARLSGTDGTGYVIDGGCGTASTNDFVIDKTTIYGTMAVTLLTATFIQPAS